jgi:ribonucleotide monophosphatase NagD (HAD superfamily)
MDYPEHDPRNAVVAFDFDGVLAEATWPSPGIGKPVPAAAEAVKHYYDAGCEIVVMTARPDEHLPRVRTWIRKNGLDRYIYEVTNRKVVACLYFDDRAVRWPLG